MSHEVEVVNGVAQMAFAGQVPWHGLGTKVAPDLTPRQFQKAAGLNWGVTKRPSFVTYFAVALGQVVKVDSAFHSPEHGLQNLLIPNVGVETAFTGPRLCEFHRDVFV